MTKKQGSTHTPGPWHVENKGDMPAEKWIMADRWTRVARADGGNAANFIANAQLLAAAPELLTALRDVIDELRAIKDLEVTVTAATAIMRGSIAVKEAENGS